MTIREIIKRDLGVKIEGVVKVFDRAALASEFREYVVTDKIEEELKKIFDTFTQVSDTLRRGGRPRDVMGMWVSGFFGSGKSHFAKVLGYLLENDDLGDGSALPLFAGVTYDQTVRRGSFDGALPLQSGALARPPGIRYSCDHVRAASRECPARNLQDCSARRPAGPDRERRLDYF
jgi:hypothetical protein